MYIMSGVARVFCADCWEAGSGGEDVNVLPMAVTTHDFSYGF